MKFICSSDIGRVRKNNEDSCDGVIVCTKSGIKVGIFAIADGMGGHNKGEVASKLAIESVIEFLSNNIEKREDVNINLIDETIKKAYGIANTVVYEKSKSDISYDGMGTTLTIAIIVNEDIAIANIGDSRCYIYNKETGLLKITKDHSIVEELVNANVITEKEAMVHPDRNKITRAVGTEPTIVVDIYKEKFISGDTVMLSTDGLSGAVDKCDMEEILACDIDLDNKSQKLIEIANEKYGKDNITVVLVDEK